MREWAGLRSLIEKQARLGGEAVWAIADCYRASTAR